MTTSSEWTDRQRMDFAVQYLVDQLERFEVTFAIIETAAEWVDFTEQVDLECIDPSHITALGIVYPFRRVEDDRFLLGICPELFALWPDPVDYIDHLKVWTRKLQLYLTVHDEGGTAAEREKLMIDKMLELGQEKE